LQTQLISLVVWTHQNSHVYSLSRTDQSPDFTGCFPPRYHRLYSPLSPDVYQASPSALSRKSETHVWRSPDVHTALWHFFFYKSYAHKRRCFHNRAQRRSYYGKCGIPEVPITMMFKKSESGSVFIANENVL